MKASMKRTIATLVLTLGATPVLAAACEDAYVATVEPVLAKRCVACHNKAAPGSGVTFQKGTGYEAIVNVASTQAPEVLRVNPGDPATSYLYQKLMGTQDSVGGTGARMPIGGKLNDKELALVETWITGCVIEGAEAAEALEAPVVEDAAEAASSEPAPAESSEPAPAAQ